MRLAASSLRVAAPQLSATSAQSTSFVDVTYDPAAVRKPYADQFIKAVNQASNHSHIASFLSSTYGVSAGDIAARNVRLRILWGTTIFGHRGRHATAEERYGVQLEKKDASGQYVPVAPAFGAAVQWERDAGGFVKGFSVRLSKS